MKKILLVPFSILLLAACNEAADTEENNIEDDKLSTELVENPLTASGVDTGKYNELPKMVFQDTMHSFGTINEGEKVTYDFDFKNEGNTPLIISSASGSCGCTVPEYPKDPIQPGASGTIKVMFNSDGKSGHQRKSVTVMTNSQKGVHILNIETDVTPKS